MKEEIRNKIAAQATEIHFAENLPGELEGFKLNKIFAPLEDKFIFRKKGNAYYIMVPCDMERSDMTFVDCVAISRWMPKARPSVTMRLASSAQLLATFLFVA